MIGITKPAEPPEVLSSEATRRRIADCCTQFDSAADDYRSGERKFAFSDSIYNHESVKQLLIQAQHDKCCFCEMKIADGGDVEHFRPKSGYRQRAKSRLERPGYYWLAYEWSNLFFACPICNQRFKRSLFPLADETHRARSHNDDLGREDPLLINPVERNPEDYIAFRGEKPYAIDDNPYGATTIRVLGLHRRNLLDRRREHLNDLRQGYWKVIQLEAEYGHDPVIRTLIEQAKARLVQATSDEAEFAAATRAAVRSEFRFVLDTL